MQPTTKIRIDLTGPIWFIGWLFTVAYAELALVQAIFAALIWPWYLGIALR